MLPPHSPPISPVSPLSGPHSPPISLSSPSMSPSMSPLSGPHSSPISLSSPSMSPLSRPHSPTISLSSPSMSPLSQPHSPPISLLSPSMSPLLIPHSPHISPLSPTMSPQPPTISPKPPPLSPLSSSMLTPWSFQSSSTSELSSALPKPFLANHQSPSLSPTKLLQSNSKLPESYSPSLLPSTHSVTEPESPAKKSIAKDIDCLRILPLNKKLEHSQLPPYIQDVLPDNCSYMFSGFEYLCEHTKAFCATMFINVHSEEMAKQWLKEKENKKDVTYRITRGVPIKEQKVLYKTIRHCQHKRKQPLKSSSKHPNSINRRDKNRLSSTTHN